jgi:isopropylmalate/homocitrate/citramalate synthase
MADRMTRPEVRIYEVGPRDGLQAEATVVPTEAKLAFIGMLADAGLREIEATSFVRPDAIPQMADADELLSRLERRPGARYAVLVRTPEASSARSRPRWMPSASSRPPPMPTSSTTSG